MNKQRRQKNPGTPRTIVPYSGPKRLPNPTAIVSKKTAMADRGYQAVNPTNPSWTKIQSELKKK